MSVTPDGTAVTALYGSSSNSVTFTISNGYSEAMWYLLSCAKTGVVSSCSISGATSGQIGANSSINRTVYYSMGAGPGTGTVRLTAVLEGEEELCMDPPEECPPPPGGSDEGYYNVSAPSPLPATVDITRYPARHMDYGRSLQANFAAVHAQSTIPYFSLDAARGVTLVYNEDRTSLKPFVFADISHSPGTPDTVKLQVKVNGAFVTFLNGEQTIKFSVASGGAQHRIGGQFDASSYGTGRHAVDIIVTSVYNAIQAGYNPGTVATTRATDLIVLDERSSPIGRGWTIAGWQRLYPLAGGAVLIAEGDGSYHHFLNSGGVLYSPVGDFTKVQDLGGGTGWVRKYADSTKAIFNGSGRLTGIVNRFADTTKFTYDGSNRPWKITDPQGLVTELAYGSYGLASIKDPFNRYTYTTVQSNGTLTEFKDPDNVKTTFGYDGSLRLQTITDRAGKATTLSYDSQSGKLASVQAPQVYVSGVGNRNPTTWLEPWQKRGVPYSGTSTPFSAPRLDSVDARVWAPDSVAIRYRVFDAFGQPGFAHSPYGLVDTAYYDSNGQLTDRRTPGGMRSTFTYDAAGFMTQSVVDGKTINRTNGGWGQASYISGDVTSQNIYLNGTNGRVDSIRLAGNNALKYRYTYDSRGRVSTATDPESHLMVRRWYAGTNGNRSKDSLPGGRVTTYGYDYYGRDSSVSATGVPTRRVLYDLVNRPTAAYDGVNTNPTQFAYDSLYLRNVTDPKSQVYQYVRDALGRVTGQIDPVGRRDTTEYGWLSEVRRYVNRRGQAITLAYDSLARRTIRQGTNLTADTLSYSANGRTVIGASETSIESVYLNERGQPDSVKTVFRADGSKVFWRRYGYDARGRVTSVLRTGSSVYFDNKVYDWAGEGTLTDLTLGSTTETTFGYNNDLRRTTTTLPGTSHTIVQGFSTVHSVIDRTSVVLEDKSHYSANRQMDRLWYGGPTNGQKRYTYDGLQRLTDVVTESGVDVCINFEWDNGWWCNNGTQDDSTHFDYDQVGNRTDLSGSYNTGNRITAFDGCSYGTDYDGNVTSRTCTGDTVTFSWNAVNQLTGYTRNDSTVSFRYDAFNRLVEQWGAPVDSLFFLWDRGHLLAALWGHLQSAAAHYSYYPGTDRLHAVSVGTTQYYAHQDGLGNVRALTTSDKVVRRTYSYDEWGQLVGGSDNASLNGRDRARFKGALWFGDGGVQLYYMRNRWYEPRTGRFLSEDPIGLAGGNNLYRFASADPINGYDPFGLTSGGCPEGWEPVPFGNKIWCVPPELPPIVVEDDYPGIVTVEFDDEDPTRGGIGGGIGPQGQSGGVLQCTAALASAVLSGVIDFTALKGLKIGITLGRAALRQFAAASHFGNAGLFRSALDAHRLGRLARAGSYAGYEAGLGAWAGNASEAPLAAQLTGGDISGWDFIPGAATVDAAIDAVKVCRRAL